METKQKIQIEMVKGHKYRYQQFLLFFDTVNDRFVSKVDQTDEPLEIRKMWLVCDEFIKVNEPTYDEVMQERRRTMKYRWKQLKTNLGKLVEEDF